MDIRSSFSTEPVNTGRQPEVDLLRGFAVLFMIWVHVILSFPADEPTLAFRIVTEILGSPLSAPMFMIALGISTCYSRSQSAGHLLRRAFAMLWIGLALNAARFVIPSLIFFLTSGMPVPQYWLYNDLFGGDILQLAFLTFLFLAFARWRKWSHGKLLLISVAASLVGWALRWKPTGNVYADTLLCWVWATNESGCFPLLNWLIFPAAGVCIGQTLLHCRDKLRLYRLVSPICLLAGAGHMCYSFATSSFYLAHEYAYYHLTTADAFFIILLAVGLLGLNALLIQQCRGWRFPLLSRLSRNVNAVYCIHWTLLMHFSVLCSIRSVPTDFTFLECTVITIVLLFISDLLASAWAAWKNGAVPLFSLRTARSLRVLNAILFAGGVSVQRIEKE